VVGDPPGPPRRRSNPGSWPDRPVRGGRGSPPRSRPGRRRPPTPPPGRDRTRTARGCGGRGARAPRRLGAEHRRGVERSLQVADNDRVGELLKVDGGDTATSSRSVGATGAPPGDRRAQGTVPASRLGASGEKQCRYGACNGVEVERGSSGSTKPGERVSQPPVCLRVGARAELHRCSSARPEFAWQGVAASLEASTGRFVSGSRARPSPSRTTTERVRRGSNARPVNRSAPTGRFAEASALRHHQPTITRGLI
jgi:hypothetical protein